VKEYRCALVGLTAISSAPAAPTLQGGRMPLPYSHAAALAMLPNTRVVAICDLVAARNDDFHQEWGTTWPVLATYTDLAAMLAEEEIDILAVCTPDNKHAEIVIAAADCGIPAIMCEKPLATTLADADRMIAALDRNGTVCAVEHTRRWDPFFHRVREMIETGLIGEVRTIISTLHGERAMLFRNGTHILDLICYYAGAAPSHVVAILEPGFEQFREYQGDGGHAPESEPGASALILFENGVRAFYNGTKGTPARTEWDIAGTTGRIRISGDDAEFWSLVEGELVKRPFPAAMVMTGALVAAYADLIEALECGGATRSPAREARQSVALIEGILASQQQGNRLVPIAGQGSPAARTDS